MAKRFSFALAVWFALTLSVHTVGELRHGTTEPVGRDAAPALTNPGGQVDPLTSEFGYAAAVLARSPIAYWRLEDYAGTTAQDSSASSHHGAITAGVARAQQGALANGSLAMRFGDATGTRIDIADDSAFALTDAFTVEAWAKVDSQGAAGSILEKISGTDTSYRLAQEAGSWTWSITGTFGTLNRWVAVSAEDAGTWVHLVGTFDGTTTKLYKNGVLVQSHAAVGTLSAGSGSTRIGLLANGGYPFTGALDDIAVYPVALNAGQIASHYALRTSPSWISLPLSATDPESDPLTYTATGLPPGLWVHPTTGVIAGNPTVAGTYSVTATVTDPGALSSSETFEWIILSPAAVNPNRPWIANPGPQSSALTIEQGYAGAVMMANPIGYWRLEEFSGSSVADWSGAGHAGVATGGMVRGVSGALADRSLAMQFDGELTTRIDITDDSAFRLIEAVTVEVWAKTTQASATGVLFDKTQGGATNASYRLMQEGDAWVWRVVGSFGTVNRSTPVTAGDVGTWVHLVGTFDGQATRLYKNGVLMQSHEAVGTLTTGAGVTRIGLLGYDAYAFPGSIDEVAVYASALSTGQVASHYALRTATSSVVLELDALEPDSEAMTFAASGLPPGLVINPITGTISGNPTTSGSYTVTVAVSDPGGLTVATVFPWTITTPAAINPHRPVLANPGPRTNTIVPGYGYPAGILTASPVGHWRLDDPSGSTATDKVNVPHHGTLHGGVTHAQAGALSDGSMAMRFDGLIGSRIEIAATPSLEVTNAVTVELWAKADAQSAYGGLFDKTIAGATDQSYELLQETDRWSWWVMGTFGMVNVWTPVEASDVGTWVHLVATFDGSTAKLYKNGQLVASTAAEGTLTAGEGVALIGHLGSNIFPFAGVIDEVSVYSVALTPSQITSHYDNRLLLAAVALQLAAIDPDGDALTYSATGLPSTLVINPQTGLISGNPTATGTHAVTATVRDPGGLAASQTFTWTLAPPATTVTVTTPFPGTVFKAPINLTLAATVQSAGTITQVQFFDAQTSLGIDTIAPYEFAWTSIPVGAHAIRAVATGSLGDTTESAPVTFSVTSSGSGSGTLGTPVATPAPGVHGGPLNVTLSAAPDATIRYTTDGSTPNATSPIYSGPIAVTDVLVLEARAFQSGWTTSPSFTGTYRLDTTPPEVTAIVTPPPNAAGWNNTAVTIRFECVDAQGVGVAQCPSDATVNDDGANQVITRTATDRAGNSIAVNVTINIDTTAPMLTLTEPLPRTTESASLAVSGTVSDSLSDAASVKCNGEVVAPQGGAFACTFSLEPGGNPILISAIDGAGNVSSVSSRTRLTNGAATELRLSPKKFSLLVGGARVLKLSDNFERVVGEADWTSADDSIATIVDGVVTALGPGTTTVTATKDSLSASVEVTVYGGTALPTAALRWEEQPTPGYTIGQALIGMPDGLHMTRFAVEYPTGGSVPPRVTALNEEGEVKWSSTLPVTDGASGIPYSNSLGGLLIEEASYSNDRYVGSIFTIRADGTPGWRREFTASLPSILGQGPEGTIFLSEWSALPGRPPEQWITVLDGESGSTRARVPLPLSSEESSGSCAEGPNEGKQYYSGELSGRTAIDATDTAHLFVYSSQANTTCAPPHNFTHSFSSQLALWSISPYGAVTSRHLVDRSVTGAKRPEMAGGDIVPTPDGDVVFYWDGRDPIPGTDDYQEYAFLSSSGGSSIPLPDGLGRFVMGEDNTIFAEAAEGVAAIDATSLSTRWTTPGGGIVTSTDGGGVLLHDGEFLHTVDAAGAVTASTALSISGKPSGSGWIEANGTLSEREIPPIHWPAVGFSMFGGSVLGQNGPMNCEPQPLENRLSSSLRNYFFTYSVDSRFQNAYLRQTIKSAGAAWESAGYLHYLQDAASAGVTQNANVQFAFHPGTMLTPEGGITLYPIPDYDLSTDSFKQEYDLVSLYFPLPDQFKISLRLQDFDAFPGTAQSPVSYKERLLRFTAMHEFGHLIGLKHVELSCGYAQSVMSRRAFGTAAEAERNGWVEHLKPTPLDERALNRLFGRQ